MKRKVAGGREREDGRGQRVPGAIMGMHFLAITAGGFWVGACRLPGRYNNPRMRREQEEHLAHWLRLLSALVCVSVCV